MKLLVVKLAQKVQGEAVDFLRGGHFCLNLVRQGHDPTLLGVQPEGAGCHHPQI